MLTSAKSKIMGLHSMTKIKRVACSTFVLLLLILVGVDAFVRYAKPLRYLNATSLTSINQNPIVAKLRDYLDSQRNADVIVVGTSLTLVPAVRLDDAFHGQRTRYDDWYGRNHLLEYDKADYLAHLLSEAIGHPTDVANLGIVGSLMSDHYLIVEKALAAGKHPKAIVLMLAPRDFMDNTRSEVDKTPVYNILADFTAFNDFMAKNPPPDRIFDFVVGNFWNCYKVKGDVKTILTTFACRHLDRQASLFLSNKFQGKKYDPNDEYKAGRIVGVLDKVTPVYTRGPNVLSDIGEYKNVYLPINNKMIAEQEPYLERLLKLAHEKQIPVLVVNSPLMKENLALLPANVLSDYQQRLRRLSSQYEAVLFEPMESQSYVLTDFEDSCHMNAQGGKKFYTQLIQKMTEDKTLAQSLGIDSRLCGRQEHSY
jgi:hypothetical protein